jgi:hypothetical protein
MNEYALRLERELRTLRDYLLFHVPAERRDTCIGIYAVDIALDTVDAANSTESAFELQLPPELPKRAWCTGCDDKPCRGMRR